MNLNFCIGHDNFKSGAAMTQSSSGSIYHCTFWDNYEASQPGNYGIWINATGTWNIKNNITEGHEHEIYISATAVAGGVTLASDYNIFNDSRGGDAFHYNGTDYNFADYKTNSSKDTNSIIIDPKLVSTGKLYSISPCLDIGAVIAGVNDGGELDIWGNATDGTPNIGAYQGAGEAAGDIILRKTIGLFLSKDIFL